MTTNKPSWTPEQDAAIRHSGSSAIIDANAGAGKTAVLTAKVVNLLSDEQKKMNAAGLVIITFTKKAAAELKTRLNRKMREQISLHPEKADFLRRQCADLHKARISTISSFCFSLIRENIEHSELSSGFTIMEASRARIMHRAMTEQAIENFYSTASEQELKLILEHFAGKNDTPFVDAVLGIINYAANLPDPDGWYSLCTDSSRLDDIMNEAMGKLNNALSELPDLIENLQEALDSLCKKDKPKVAEVRAIECINDAIPFFTDRLSDIKDAADNDFCSVSYMDIKDIKTSIPDFTKTKIGDSSAAVKKTADTLAEIYDGIKTVKYLKNRLYKSQPVIDILIKIARESERLYKAEKSAQNLADYADAERQLYNMLKSHPDIAKNAGIELFIVDEFQDSNRLQYEIFRALSDEEKNLYFVGDMKQSIYAFRGAQSEVFDEVTKNPLYKHIYLNHNFRSRDNVIDGINDIFCSIMTEKLGGVDYAKNSRLILGNTKNTSTDPADITEVLVVTDKKKDSDSDNTEADYVAYHINKMIKSGYMVEGRPCKAEDFAILLRSGTKKAQLFASALAEYDIRAVTRGDGKMFSEPEIVIMTDYLKVIDDPYNNESLARLLMSCLFGFTADDMAALRTCTAGFDIKGISSASEECRTELEAYVSFHKKQPLYSCLKRIAENRLIDEKYSPCLAALCKEQPSLFEKECENKCAAFEAQLDRLRGVMATSSPAQLIKHIYDTTATADLLTVGEDAENRVINLMALLSMAEEFDNYHSNGILSEFLHHISEMERQDQGAEIADNTAKSGVQIMTIHGSKGLQYPIVYVCDCAKKFNTDDSSKSAIMSDKYGVCIMDTDKSMMAKIPSPAYDITAKIITEKMRSEEMRLLYVAATRAMYKLIFTGCRENGLDKLKSANDELRKSSYLSWLLVPYLMGNTANISYKAVSIAEKENDITDTVISDKNEIADADEKTISLIKEQITAQYSHTEATKLAAKYTATGLAAMKRQDTEKKCELYVSKPSFAKSAGRLSGKKRGDAYHKLMEHIPFTKPMTEQETADFIENCTADFLSDAERACISPSDISAFFDNDVSSRMISSGRVYREYPIFHRLSEDIMAEISVECTDANRPYVQGIADMFFIEDDGIVLIDYKTDSFSDEDQLSEDYSFQLRVYEEALSTAFSLPVKEKYIYSFKMGKMIKL